jgi:hypothetical protein
MLKPISSPKRLVLFVLLFLLAAAGCKPSASSTTTVPTVIFTGAQLEYQLLAQFPDVFWCDPDYYPVAHPGQEQQNAIAQFSAISANQSEFSAILQKLNLPQKSDYTDAEKLAVYQEYKKLTYGVQLTASGGGYNFTLRVGQGQGETITGTISAAGEVQITQRTPSVNSCPICLVKGTLISTPSGPVPVEELTGGMTVWTMDADGNKAAAVLVEVASTPVPLFFKAVSIQLQDGRSVIASPGHPTAGGKPIADYQAGDILDGSVVVSTAFVTYDSAKTYDILPSGPTGFYWANGILLGSTLKN